MYMYNQINLEIEHWVTCLLCSYSSSYLDLACILCLCLCLLVIFMGTDRHYSNLLIH